MGNRVGVDDSFMFEEVGMGVMVMEGLGQRVLCCVVMRCALLELELELEEELKTNEGRP